MIRMWRLIAATITVLFLLTMGAAYNRTAPDESLDDPDMTTCYTEGNMICGDPKGEFARQAWETWDKQNGGRYLKVDPSRTFRVDYIGTAKHSPYVQMDEVALPYRDGWFIFRASYTDGLEL
jgi:hypothetical protein